MLADAGLMARPLIERAAKVAAMVLLVSFIVLSPVLKNKKKMLIVLLELLSRLSGARSVSRGW